MWKYFLLWFPMLLLAVANGTLREAWIRKHTGELQAHQISTVLLLLLFGVYTWIVVRVWPLETADRAITVGLLWLVLTLAFEFLFGHYASHLSWSTLLHEYDLLAGRLWALVPLWVMIAPYVFYRLRQAR
ncbi:MAG TPA: hypothetical protein VGS07_11310 [Thermoanaerobaculia bacterium]|jgi:hypothetical protein|nr:hypothetical protein [Thermoanaerobaculia bacterium]